MLNEGLSSSNNSEWETPQWLFNMFDNIHHFTLDACSTDANAKCQWHYTKREDGLNKSWECERVFMNPPYGREIGKWVEKCSKEQNRADLITALLPARTDTRWFHDYIYEKEGVVINFLKGRLKFEIAGEPMGPAPFPSMIVQWNRTEPF